MMIEEAYVRLYTHDFVQMAGRSELGQNVQDAADRRVADARAHAVIMDARKGPGHLEALIGRLREAAPLFNGRVMLAGADPAQAAERRRIFLTSVADALSVAPALSATSDLIAA